MARIAAGAWSVSLAFSLAPRAVNIEAKLRVVLA